MKLQDILVPTYVQMLRALSAWLEKAETAVPENEMEPLLTARLAADMFPLSTQICFACVQAQEGIFRLRQEAFPASIEVLLDAGRNAAERPGSIDDARARIAETIRIVESAVADAPHLAPTATIAHRLPLGMTFDLTAEQYVRDWALPQFYFHVMTAYAILRAQGIDLGKPDYVAHMFMYLRPSAASSE